MGRRSRRAFALLGGAVALAVVDGAAVARWSAPPRPSGHNTSHEEPLTRRAFSGTLGQRIIEAFDDDDPAAAAELLEEYLERYPNDAVMLYNAACAHARLG
ncbi:MAG: hypothetical protein ACYTGC_16990, partial [Planctomycetota bacterium]